MRWVAQTTLKTMRDMGPPPRGVSWVTQTDPKNKIENLQKRAKILVECSPVGHHCNQLKDLDPRNISLDHGQTRRGGLATGHLPSSRVGSSGVSLNS
jgi:hypothetical protein